jgi:hypothetical protein
MLNKIKPYLSILNNKTIYFVGIALLIMLLLKQCNATADAKKEADRNFNNLLAQRDSVRVLESKNGNMLVERAAFQLKFSELSKDQKDLIERLELAGKKKPSVVIQTEIVYRDSSIMVPVAATQVGDDKFLEFSHNPKLPGSNKLAISGQLPYSVNLDTIWDGTDKSKFRFRSSVIPGTAKLSIEQKIDLVTGLYTDPKTGRLFVRASTTFPGITFSEMQALDMVDDPATKKALKQARKPFGLGVSVGYGLTVGKNGYISGPSVGLGLIYSPKWLQFGK